MATGSGPLAVRLPDGGTSNITPTYDVPNTSRLYEQMGDAAGRLAGTLQGAMDRRSARSGARAGAEAAAQTKYVIDAGETPTAHPDAGHGAYAKAFYAANLAGLKNDIDNRDAVLRAEHQYDPQAYEAAAGKAKSGFIQGSAEEQAVEVENYATAKFDDGYATLSRVAATRQTQEAAQALGVRVKSLDAKLRSLASAGNMDSQDFQRAQSEREALQIERAGNPAILYSDAERAYDNDELDYTLQGDVVAHAAIDAAGDAGGGQPGLAAASRVLDNDLLNSEAFKALDPDRRLKIYNNAKAQVSASIKDDIEQRRAEEAQAREKRAEQREAVGSLRLGIMLGDVTEASIKARDDLDDADKASLIAGARSMARRDRAEARSAAALERAGAAANYREFSDASSAGTLSEGEIADALHAGMISPGQARTLAAKRDKSLAPVVEDVLAPVKDAATRPGRRPSAEKMARAEEAATIWARQNPNATLEEKLKAGRVLAERVYGAPKTTPGPAAGASGAVRSGKIAKAKADFAAGRINLATKNARMKEAMDAH